MRIFLYILSVNYHRYLYLIILYHVSKRRAKKIPFYKLQETASTPLILFVGAQKKT